MNLSGLRSRGHYVSIVFVKTLLFPDAYFIFLELLTSVYDLCFWCFSFFLFLFFNICICHLLLLLIIIIIITIVVVVNFGHTFVPYFPESG